LTVEPPAPEPANAARPNERAAAPPIPAQKWQPADAVAPCNADGVTGLDRAEDGAPFLDSCAVGALIGKIGGSAADVKAEKDKVTIFAVGRHCVFSGPEAGKTGALYLGVNDAPALCGELRGTLEVTISAAV
jgi:hypothetical protein